MIKAIILDMDGTMFDTEPLWEKAFLKAGKDLGYNFTKELHEKSIGTNQIDLDILLKEELGEEFPVDDFSAKYVENMKKLIDEQGILIKKGLIKLLDYLIENEYIIAIASSSDLEMIKRNLNIVNIKEDIFKAIVSGEDFDNGKPAPDIFLKTCEILSVKPEDTIVIEDSNNGIKSAYNAGCIPVLIPDVDKITPETEELARYNLNTLLDVIDILKNKK